VRATFKGLVCFFCFCVYFLAEALLVFVFFFLSKGTKRRWAGRCVHVFARCLTGILGIRVRVTGAVEEARGLRGALLAPNHLSYIDGFAMAATFPLIFVSKSDLRSWPVIGWMTRLSGTIFIDRGRRNHLVDSVREMAAALAQGANVLFFPEGTSTNGETLLPFKSTFFDAPVEAGASVVPVSIVYQDVDGAPFSRANRDRVCWYGEMTFWDHFVSLLRSRWVDVTLEIHEPVWADAPAGSSDVRKELSDRTYASVKSGVRLLT